MTWEEHTVFGANFSIQQILTEIATDVSIIEESVKPKTTLILVALLIFSGISF